MKRFVVKRFVVIFSLALAAFGLINLAASVLLSYNGDVPDGVDRLGFPLVFKQSAGPVDWNYFSYAALFGDVAIGIAVSALAGIFYATVYDNPFGAQPLGAGNAGCSLP
jgi:hypothetical protein